jgi:hypothetical protein
LLVALLNSLKRGRLVMPLDLNTATSAVVVISSMFASFVARLIGAKASIEVDHRGCSSSQTTACSGRAQALVSKEQY